MKQISFTGAAYAGQRKQICCERFLIEMVQVVPWKGLVTLMEPHYPESEGGRPVYPFMGMLRVHLMQNWFGYSDPAMEESLHEATILRLYAGLSLDRISDETTILNFRRRLEKNELAVGILQIIYGYLGERGLMLRQGTVAKVADVTRVDQLLHGEETYVGGDEFFTGVEKRSEHQDRKMIWSIKTRPNSHKKHPKKSLIGHIRGTIECTKAQRAKVEHPFRVVECLFGYVETLFRGLAKNTAQMVTLYALSNLWMARRHLLGNTGQMRL
jgi:IS5 family transposase